MQQTVMLPHTQRGTAGGQRESVMLSKLVHDSTPTDMIERCLVYPHVMLLHSPPIRIEHTY